MRVIILAAGRGSRLADFNPDGRPKCLLEIGGKTLLQRHLELLADFRIAQVDLVIGYEADRIVEHIGTLAARPQVWFHFNPRFDLGSVISLLAAREVLDGGTDTLVMDADVLYHPDILQRLVEAPSGNSLLFDADFEPGDEPVKIVLQENTIVEFRKQLPAGLEYDRQGESVGFIRLTPAMAARAGEVSARFDAEGRGDAPHEEVLRELILLHPDEFNCVDISGSPWLEIDFPADMARAENVILPAIRASCPRF